MAYEVTIKMTSVQYYDSPLGRIQMASDEIGLTVLYFEGAKYDADRLPNEYLEQETEILSAGKRWLELEHTSSVL